MSRNLSLFFVILCFLMAGTLQAASVDQAKSYVQNRELARAKQELAGVLASDAADEEMAAALDLMASIAVEEQDYATAADMWGRLVADYPELGGELGAGTKLQLAEALLGREDVAATEPTAPAAPVVAVPAPVVEVPETVVTVPEPEPSSPAAPARQAAAVPAPESAPREVRAEEPVSPRVPGLVLVTVAGKPYDATQYSGDRLTTFLVERGVDAENPTGGIPVVESSAASLARMLEAVEDQGGESLAFLRVNFVSRQKIALEVYSPDGSLLWKEKVSGGTGHTGRVYSKTGANEKLLERFFDKLAERVGGPGLPVTR